MVVISSVYFPRTFSDVSAAVKPSRSKVKQMNDNKCEPTIQLNPVNTAAELYEKTYNIIDNHGKHNPAKTRR